MNGREFIRQVRRYGRKVGVSVRLEPTAGKGSHQRLYLGDRFTTVQHGELKPGVFRAMLRQLGIDPKEF